MAGVGGNGGHGHGNHSHKGGSCSCEHDHDEDDVVDRGTLYSLYLNVDTERVQCLNEVRDGSAKTVFKPWNERLDKEKAEMRELFENAESHARCVRLAYQLMTYGQLYQVSSGDELKAVKQEKQQHFVESDVDQELLFHIPFTGNVKLKGVIVIGGEEDTHPSKMMLYKNRPDMTFDDSGCEPEQEFDMQPDSSGSIEYITKAARFNSVNHLTIFFPKNFGADTTKVYYIGLRGDFTKAHRQEVLIVTYESQANPADHKVDSFDSVLHEIQ